MKNNFSSFLDIMYLLIKWRKFIFQNFILISLFSLGFSFLLPKWFASSTTLITSSDQSSFNLSSLVGNLPFSGLMEGAVSEEANIYLAIINSRTVMEKVATKFDLQKRYKKKDIEKTVKELRHRVSSEINEDGTITLTARAKTSFIPTHKKDEEARELARDMANYFITVMDSVNIQLKSDKARNTRTFIEKRYNQNIKELNEAEEKFKDFQEEYGAIALPEQTEATIKVAANFKAQLIAKQMKVDVLKSYMGDTHSDYIKAFAELREIKRQYQKFNSGVDEALDNPNTSGSSDLFIAFDKAPELGILYARLLREVTLQEAILEFILPQYEQAKIQESKNSPTVQILDKAVKPIKKSKPKKAFFILFMGMLSIVLSSSFVLFKEKFEEMRENDTEIYRKIVGIKSLVKK